ncbi:MAG: hypothetical protein KZQ95_20705 [Candidatus Thiodiazotropha sp. (ex Epidulcina cf. delphinae)]|nr:hypothetical protein [Candidatus Thiodiazotropha sp. (ex Epidulcina cf. delphinae)]
MLKHLLRFSMMGVLILAGCGGGDDVNVDEFDVTGTSADLEEGRAPIDPAINDGNFELTWKVDDDDALSYTATFYLSVNSNLSRNNDIEFASILCDNFLSCDNDKRNDEDCYFTNDLEMYCGDEDSVVQYDVDEVVDSLPMDAYIIIEACTLFDCDTETHPVRLL